AGARRLDTLVVVPAGNDGRAGPGFGVVSGPGAAPQGLAVGAIDSRRTTDRVRVVVRVGLNVVLDERLPLGGAVAPAKPLGLTVAPPARAAALLLAALRRGADAGVSIGVAEPAPNPDAGEVAPFSSTGLAFDGRVKPNLVAPGIALATAEPGADATGAPRFGTV